MTTKKETLQPAKAQKESNPQPPLKTPDVGIIMSPYIPYVIAGSFIVMTALLTLLLSAIMDNKGELEKTIAQIPPQPILADARVAFGQEGQSLAKKSDTPALLQEDIAVPPAINEQNTGVQAEPVGTALAASEPNIPAPATPSSNEDTIVESVGEKAPSAPPVLNTALPATIANIADIPDKSEVEIVTPSPEITKSTDNILAASKEETTTILPSSNTKPLPAIAVNTDHISKTVEVEENHKSMAGTQSIDEAATIENDLVTSASHDLDRVVDAHEARINDIRTVITLHDTNKRQVEQAITYHLNLMEMQVRYIEDSIRPVAYPRAIASYERMVNRRREAFHRRMRHREELRQRIYESRNLLRRQYTQLLDLLRDKNQGIV